MPVVEAGGKWLIGGDRYDCGVRSGAQDVEITFNIEAAVAARPDQELPTVWRYGYGSYGPQYYGSDYNGSGYARPLA